MWCADDSFVKDEKIYFLYMNPSSWDDARTACKSFGGDLAQAYSDPLDFRVEVVKLFEQTGKYIIFHTHSHTVSFYKHHSFCCDEDESYVVCMNVSETVYCIVIYKPRIQ